jgi:hypothetical protein
MRNPLDDAAADGEEKVSDPSGKTCASTSRLCGARAKALRRGRQRIAERIASRRHHQGGRDQLPP